MKRVLVLSPHGDDAELAMGGTMARMVEDGFRVTHVLMSASDYSTGGRLIEAAGRVKEFHRASDVLGCLSFFVPLFDENRADKAEDFDMVGRLERVIGEHKPDELYVPLPWFNIDHQVAWRVITAALRPVPNVFHPMKVLAYEMPGQEWGPRTDLSPVYTKIGEDHLRKKIEALACYRSQGASQRGRLIGPEGVRVIARNRGIEVDTMYAERHRLVMEIVS